MQRKSVFFLFLFFYVFLSFLGCPIPNPDPPKFDPSKYDFDLYLEEENLIRLKAPQNIRIEDGFVKWNVVLGATGYIVEVDGVEEILGKVTEYKLENVVIGDIKVIKLKSIGDGKNILDSVASFSLTYDAKIPFPGSQGGAAGAPVALMPIPITRQVAWQKLEQYAFIHFGPNTFRNAEWGEGKPAEGAAFAPTKNSAEYTAQWVNELKKIGMNGIILTAKHHDGFCLWQTKTTKHSLRNPSYSGGGSDDVVRDLSNSAQAKNMILGLYVSPWDRNNWAYLHHEYAKIFKEQVREISTMYGPIFEVWFDGANETTGWYGGSPFNWHKTTGGAPALPLDADGNWINNTAVYDYYPSTNNPTTMVTRDYATSIDGISYPGRNEFLAKMKEDAKLYIKEHQPNAVIFGDGSGEGIRWIGNEQGWAGRTCWAMGWGTSGDENAPTWNPGECDMKTHTGWFHSTAAPDPKGGANAHKNYIEYWYRSVGRNATLLLNFSPGRDGLIPAATLTQANLFWDTIKADFATNIAKTATSIEASSIRGGSNDFSPLKLIDENFDTYWATDDFVTENVSVTLKFDNAITFDRVLLQEYIPLGQRVKSFKVEYSTTDNGNDFQILEYPDMPWTIHGDTDNPDITTTIGYKRILRCYQTNAKRVKITFIQNRKPRPFVISEIGLYDSPTSNVTK